MNFQKKDQLGISDFLSYFQDFGRQKDSLVLFFMKLNLTS